jgi:hypothetical protein
MGKTRKQGHLGTGGQRGRVFDRGGCSATILGTEYKEPQKVIKKWIRK